MRHQSHAWPHVAALLALLFAAFLPNATRAQTTATPNSDPRAVSFANQSFSALVGSSPINDVTLSGTIVRTVGSDVGTGTVTLKALGTGQSRLDMNLSDGERSEIRNLPSGIPQGYWIAPNSAVHSAANHNNMTDAAWFFPALTVLSQASNSNFLFSYVGQELRNGSAVQHIRAAQSLGYADSLMQGLTTEDIYLDANSFLPVALIFNAHPDNNALANIPVEVDFSNYQAVNGVKIPFRVQQSFNGTLFLDITIQSAALNTGLPSSDFVQ
ncbi:MAG: hypothetical protein WB780_08000 [Candidatus Acidiferrales bacterium]